MFTIKLQRGHTTRLVQADSVQIFAAGPAKQMAADPKDRTNDVREISVMVEGAGSTSINRVFYVAKVKCWAHETEAVNVFDTVYIENDRGATTEIVRPF